MRHQLASQEVLLASHAKVEAMLEMILAKDLVNYPQTKLHDYLWTVSDLVDKARKLNEELLDMLVRMVPLLEVSGGRFFCDDEKA
jgi:hypothetical protein